MLVVGFSTAGWRDKRRHCLFLRMSGSIIWLTTSSMKVGVDQMHPDTSRRLLFRAVSSLCVWALGHHTWLLWNVNLREGGKSLFGKHYGSFLCNDSGFILSSTALIPAYSLRMKNTTFHHLHQSARTTMADISLQVRMT